jgi:2-oxoglutarate dehydrogenase E2 component (dihydrolipoamide succinyltransferase)
MQLAGAVVCLIDTEGAKPEGSDKSEGSTAEVARSRLKRQSAAAPALTPAAATRLRHMLQGHPPAARKILDEKKYTTSVKGTGKDGRVTKDDAVNAIYGTPTGGSRASERTKLSMLRRKSRKIS